MFKHFALSFNPCEWLVEKQATNSVNTTIIVMWMKNNMDGKIQKEIESCSPFHNLQCNECARIEKAINYITLNCLIFWLWQHFFVSLFICQFMPFFFHFALRSFVGVSYSIRLFVWMHWLLSKCLHVCCGRSARSICVATLVFMNQRYEVRTKWMKKNNKNTKIETITNGVQSACILLEINCHSTQLLITTITNTI